MKRKWWLILSIVASFALTGCGDGGSSNSTNPGTLGANQYFPTPAHIQPLEDALAYVGVRFIPITSMINGQQVTAPGIDTVYFAQVHQGTAQSALVNYEYAVENALNTMNLDNQTFFTLNVKLNLVQGLLQLYY